MHDNDIRSRTARKFKNTTDSTHSLPVVDNLLDRQFVAQRSKDELVHHEDYQTRTEARASIVEYIEMFSNPKRRHSSLGYLSPAQYEQVG
jgi:transposase InsO family protein